MKYRHYKNGYLYEVLHPRARDAGDNTDPGIVKLLVVYRATHADAIYVRPHSEFFGTVNGVKRFELIDETNEAKEKCY